MKLRQVASELGLPYESAAWSNPIGLAGVRVVHSAFNAPDESRGIGRAYIGNIGVALARQPLALSNRSSPTRPRRRRSRGPMPPRRSATSKAHGLTR